MNIHEYQAKQLLAQHGVAVPPGELDAALTLPASPRQKDAFREWYEREAK